MVISRTPFRISFFGGGTDYPAWYRQNRGSVIGTSINKYCYITCRYLPPFFDYNFRIRYTKQEYVKSVGEIKHPSVRECLSHLGFKTGVEIQHNADLPAMAGLGSSSSFTVGLLNALYALRGEMVDKRKLALDAIQVEQNRIGESVGSQDQNLAAYGGLNRIDFSGNHKIQVTPLVINPKRIDLLQKHLMLFFTGFTRRAFQYAAQQIKSIPIRTHELNAMLEIVDEAYKILLGNGRSIDDFGRLLNESWKIKRTLTKKISNSVIDEIYESALKSGALGGKLLGAGGGGFMLLFVKPEKQKRVRLKLKNLLYVPFKFENYGSQIIYKMPEEEF